MTTRSRKFTTLTSLFVTAICLVALPAIAAAPSNPALSKSAVVLERASEIITAQERAFLTQRDADKATVWVFFTDKGITTRSGFQAATASVNLTERTLNRRAKVGQTEPVFADIPVNTEYVSAVQSVGAKIRRVSRYLNAVSIEISHDQLDQLAGLSFVRRIAPVARYTRENVTEELTPPLRGGIQSVLSPGALNYGNAAQQLAQITVPEMHNKGYTGQGVTLAVFDTGYRKTHQAFANHYAAGRVLAEWDFIFEDGNTANEPADNSSQWNHGTGCWGTAGGYKDGDIYGPAYLSNFILCKTEDVRSETSAEEDNWVAALEWVDSIGADVITSSLSYPDLWTYADLDGNTTTITLAANTAAGLGIVVCNAMGNEGPGAGTLGPPADAYDILSCGAVSSTGSIASFSSRGPTADGRIKPEVCARGVSTYWASSSADNAYGFANGTSLSTPLIAGAVCLLIEAHPTWTPTQIITALKETASRSTIPDNTYGWGIISTNAANSWGASFSADVQLGGAPLTVNFTDESTVPATSILWDFGDGGTSTVTNPSHIYTQPGLYDVTLSRQTTFGELTNEQVGYVMVHADTVWYEKDSAFAGESSVLSVSLANTQTLNQMIISLSVDTAGVDVVIDSIGLGSRTSTFEGFNYLQYEQETMRYAVQLIANLGGPGQPLAPGSGEVLRVYYHYDYYELGGRTSVVDTALYNGTRLELFAATATYEPTRVQGEMRTKFIRRSDMNRDNLVDLTDLSWLISYLTTFNPIPVTLQAADFNADLTVDLSDLSAMISFMSVSGPGPVNP
ncbi:MAG: S8 family serine peptidase [bacterium]|nr:S8 family serine peptidase [bacterium]